MLFKRISRDQPDQVFAICQNVTGSTLTGGYSCVFDVGASSDGVRVTQASSADLQAYAGIADADISNNAYGRILIYGFYETVYIYSSTGSSAAGDELTVVADEWGVTPAATSGDAKSFGFLCEAVSGSSSSQYHTTAKAFIRAL